MVNEKDIGSKVKLDLDTKATAKAAQSNLSAFHSAGSESENASRISLMSILNQTNSRHYIIEVSERENIVGDIVYRRILDYILSVELYEEIPAMYIDIMNHYRFTDHGNTMKKYKLYIQFDGLMISADRRQFLKIVDLLFSHIPITDIFVSPYFLAFVIIFMDEDDLIKKSEILHSINTECIGIEGIKRCNANHIFISDTKDMKKRTTLYEISRATKDPTKIHSNDFEQVCRYFGIEAARNVYFQQIRHWTNPNDETAIILANEKTHYGMITYYNLNNPALISKGPLVSFVIGHPFLTITRAIFRGRCVPNEAVISKWILGSEIKLGLQDETKMICSNCHQELYDDYFNIEHLSQNKNGCCEIWHHSI